MTLFRYREDRAPIAVISALFAIDVLVYLVVDSIPVLALYTLIGIIPKGCVCAWNHHHQHVPVFLKAWANRLIEIVYGFHTGLVGHAWVLHHSLGHHVNYLDQDKDESRWMKNGTKMSELAYTVEVSLTSYARAWKVGARYPQKRRVFAAMTIVTSSLLVGLFVYRPLPALFVFALPMVISLFITSWATYAHHSGLGTASDFVACRNTIQKTFNTVTGNLGYHTAHHHKQGVHWSRLPALHASIAHEIPDDCYMQPGYPWRWMGETWFPTSTKAAPAAPALLPARAADERELAQSVNASLAA
jgi:fatty acid desaturase